MYNYILGGSMNQRNESIYKQTRENSIENLIGGLGKFRSLVITSSSGVLKV